MLKGQRPRNNQFRAMWGIKPSASARLRRHLAAAVRELLFAELGLDELDRGEPAVRAVRPVDVVVDAPVLEKHLGLKQGVEALAVEELVAEPAVE
jgi:hypothetical protein